MYRQHENPEKLKERLNDLHKDYCCAVDANASEEELIEIHQEMEELEERIHHAWMDQEEGDE
ncbi:MAG TPA: hypothetical protein DCW90_20980 [Lachnospiraceae bacterium]|nr:hypothetical protein [Lachnospiraceae bacterium]